MAGEMHEARRDEWPTHFAVAEAVGGEVKPFDYYQGPYIVIGEDVRIGEAPYEYCPQDMGVVRLWLTEDAVYREDTDTIEFCDPGFEDAVIAAAHALLGGE